MQSDFDDSEPSVVIEVIERRDDPRGPLKGLIAEVPGHGCAAVLDASRKGLFIAVETDAFKVGDMVPLTVRRGQLSFECRAEVIRVDGAPRRGIALRIIRMPAQAEEIFEQMWS